MENGKLSVVTSMKLKINLSYDLAILLLCKYPGVMSTFVGKKVYIRLFIVSLFIIAEIWKQSRCPYGGDCIHKLWYIPTMEYFLREKGTDAHKIWIFFANIMLSSGNQRREYIVYDYILMKFKNRRTH